MRAGGEESRDDVETGKPKVVTCPGCEGMSTLKGQPDCETCGNEGNLPVADFDDFWKDINAPKERGPIVGGFIPDQVPHHTHPPADTHERDECLEAEWKYVAARFHEAMWSGEPSKLAAADQLYQRLRRTTDSASPDTGETV